MSDQSMTVGTKRSDCDEEVAGPRCAEHESQGSRAGRGDCACRDQSHRGLVARSASGRCGERRADFRLARQLRAAVPRAGSSPRSLGCHRQLTVSIRLDGLAVGSVIDLGLASDFEEPTRAGERLREVECELVVLVCAAYLNTSIAVPVAHREGASVLVLRRQPTPAIDGTSGVSTGDLWHACCYSRPLLEIANALRRCGVGARSVSGYFDDDGAWSRVAGWLGAYLARRALRDCHGLLGHVYPVDVQHVNGPDSCRVAVRRSRRGPRDRRPGGSCRATKRVRCDRTGRAQIANRPKRILGRRDIRLDTGRQWYYTCRVVKVARLG